MNAAAIPETLEKIQPADLIATGDMGIGNTTPSSAIVAAVTGRSPEDTTGSGTGRTPGELAHKVAVVRKALEVNDPNPEDGLDVLAKVGGFEIGVLAGVVLGSAMRRRVLVLDGFISGAAALIAYLLSPLVRDYMIASHSSAEKGHGIVLSHLELPPLLDLDLRLGEGTGVVSLLLIKVTAIASLHPPDRLFALILFPCLSRWAMLLAMELYPYARREGLGSAFLRDRGRRGLWFGLGCALLASLIFGGVTGIVLLAAVSLLAWAIGAWASRLLGGLTGDIYGAVNEIAETAILVLIVFITAGFRFSLQPFFSIEICRLTGI